MAPLTRFFITTATATRNRVAYITRRNFATEAVPENFVAKRKATEEHAKCKNFINDTHILHQFVRL
jgi:hypothetical protein